MRTLFNSHGHVNLPLLFLAGAAGLLAGIGGYTFYYAKGASYLLDDPKACVNCHIMRDEYDGWSKAGHHAVATCNDCHVPHELIPKYWTKAENGFWHSKGFTFQDFHEPIQLRARSARVLERNCLRCHGDFTREISRHYVKSPGEISCVRCHRDVGHGPVN